LLSKNIYPGQARFRLPIIDYSSSKYGSKSSSTYVHITVCLYSFKHAILLNNAISKLGTAKAKKRRSGATEGRRRKGMDGVAKAEQSSIGSGLILIGLGGFANILSPWINQIKPEHTFGMMGLGVALTALELYELYNNPYERIFKRCGLVNSEGKIPLVIKKTKQATSITLVIHMPHGISQKQFEQKQTELEQALNSKIEFSFNKNLIMKLTEMNLGINYKYQFEECENPLEVFCGYTHSGKFILDIEKCPHVILAGETGGGKTSLLDVLILSLAQNKFDIDMHLIDFQNVGLGKYEDCKKVKSYGSDPEDFAKIMDEMEEENAKRLKMFRSVKNKVFIDKLSVWNQKYPDKAMPYKVVIVDEFIRLAEEQYKPILERFRTRAAMDRKTGIHYLISMQRPDVKCIEGAVKANLGTRIAFKTVTDTDSEVILDVAGAEKLKNPGRCLIKYCGEITEVQSMYIPSENILKYLKQNKLFKVKEDTYFKAQAIEDRQKHIREWHKSNVNPYGVK
jgi:S-DNA-T family DNA segregation ATPase FtsK/SpoIIIE